MRDEMNFVSFLLCPVNIYLLWGQIFLYLVIASSHQKWKQVQDVIQH